MASREGKSTLAGLERSSSAVAPAQASVPVMVMQAIAEGRIDSTEANHCEPLGLMAVKGEGWLVPKQLTPEQAKKAVQQSDPILQRLGFHHGSHRAESPLGVIPSPPQTPPESLPRGGASDGQRDDPESPELRAASIMPDAAMSRPHSAGSGRNAVRTVRPSLTRPQSAGSKEQYLMHEPAQQGGTHYWEDVQRLQTPAIAAGEAADLLRSLELPGADLACQALDGWDAGASVKIPPRMDQPRIGAEAWPPAPPRKASGGRTTSISRSSAPRARRCMR